MSTTEDLGAGFTLRLEETDDDTERVTLVHPDGSEETVVGGYEHECPEDMIWRRDLERIFRAGLEAGIAIGKASFASAVGAEGGAVTP